MENTSVLSKPVFESRQCQIPTLFLFALCMCSFFSWLTTNIYSFDRSGTSIYRLLVVVLIEQACDKFSFIHSFKSANEV